MNAGPYSSERVQKFIGDQFIPLKSQCFFDKPTELMQQFNVKWTPTLLVLDKNGKEHHRMIGYVPEDEFLAHLGLGRAMVYFDTDHLRDAMKAFTTVIELHPASAAAPEAVYFRGVAEYKTSHDALTLRSIYDTLQAKYPKSEWARRAEPYAKIPVYT